MAEMSNIQAITNIGVNLSQLIAFAGGINSFLWGWIPKVNKVDGFTKRMMLFGLGVSLLAVVMAEIAYFCAGINEILGVFAAFIMCGVTIPPGLYCYIFPFRIAKERNHPSVKKIMILNSCFFIPFNYLVSVIWACGPIKEQAAVPRDSVADR